MLLTRRLVSIIALVRRSVIRTNVPAIVWGGVSEKIQPRIEVRVMTERRDWLLTFIGAPSGGFATDQLRVMKGMFLLSKDGPAELRELYSFRPYDYGPFDAAVYHDLEACEAEGLIQSRPVGGNRMVYALTPAGESRVDQLRAEVGQETRTAIDQVKKHVTSLSFTELLKQVYTQHPDYAVRSIARV